MFIIFVHSIFAPRKLKKTMTMETYDIYFKDAYDSANKGFSIKNKEKAIRMAEDMLAERKGYVKDFVGGTISVVRKETQEEVWSKAIGE